jgi:hypothetical protein
MTHAALSGTEADFTDRLTAAAAAIAHAIHTGASVPLSVSVSDRAVSIHPYLHRAPLHAVCLWSNHLIDPVWSAEVHRYDSGALGVFLYCEGRLGDVPVELVGASHTADIPGIDYRRAGRQPLATSDVHRLAAHLDDRR